MSDDLASELRRVTVAYVDDHYMVLESLLARLEGTPNLTMLGGAGSVAALRKTRAWGADVVLLDLDLKDGSSVEENIESLLGAGSRVVIVSATRHPVTVRWAFSLGAAGYVDKDSGPAEVIAAIRAAAKGDGQYLTPSLASDLADAPPQQRPRFTPRETEVLYFFCAGMPVRLIARRLDVQDDTVNKHITRIREKFRAAGFPEHSRPELSEIAKNVLFLFNSNNPEMVTKECYSPRSSGVSSSPE